GRLPRQHSPCPDVYGVTERVVLISIHGVGAASVVVNFGRTEISRHPLRRDVGLNAVMLAEVDVLEEALLFDVGKNARQRGPWRGLHHRGAVENEQAVGG